MSDNGKATGQCLCGAVKITLTGAHREVGICHCSMCRRWSGGPLFAIEVGQDIEIEGRDQVQCYRSSDWAERGFCRTCGSNLYYRVVDSDLHIICAGLLDQMDDLALTSQIFIDQKPAFYDFANETRNLTRAEVIAMYGPSAEKK